jgi:hypothetical protein
VVVEQDRPVHITPDGLPGSAVLNAAGPWRTSGDWWLGESRLCPLPEDAQSSPASPSTSSTPATETPAPPAKTPTSNAGGAVTDAMDTDGSTQVINGYVQTPVPAPLTSRQLTSKPLSKPLASEPAKSRRVPKPPALHPAYWDRDEWDVALDDGRLYRIHYDRLQDTWFVEASLD